MKIYKYYSWQIPRCVNLWRGYYRNDTEEIGFGTDDTIADNNATEITEVEYYAHVNSAGEDVTKASELLTKLSSLSIKDFQGVKVKSKDEVIKISNNKINQLFSDPEGKLTQTEYQIRIIGQMITILFAYSGVIKYEETGIAGVINKTSADAYVLQLLPIWLQADQIKKQAEWFIVDNNL